MQSYIACRVCLITDKQFKTLESDPVIRDAYLNLVGTVDYNPLQTVCLECSALLRKCLQLRQKCMRANMVLKNIIVKKHGLISYDTIKAVDRETYNLVSNLAHRKVTSEYYISVKVENKEEEEIMTNPNVGLHDSYNENVIENNTSEVIPGNELDVETDKIEIEITNVPLEITAETQCKKRNRKKIEDKSKGEHDEKIKCNQDKKYIHSIEGHAEITHLTPEMAKQEVLLRKETDNYISKPFKCNLCFKAFGAKVPFDNHMEKHNSKFGDVECEICHLRYHDRHSHYCHVYECHTTKFKCKICPYISFSPKNIASHVAMHNGKTYECTICCKKFRMMNSFLSHQAKHSREMVCDFCGNSFTTLRGLTLHKGLRHKKEQNEKRGPFCSECNIHFANDTAWKRHLVLSSKHKVSNGCEYCGKRFKDSFELRKHLRVHAGTDFSQALKLPSKRKRSHEGHVETAECGACGEQVRVYCDTCGKICTTKSALKKHLKIHTVI